MATIPLQKKTFDLPERCSIKQITIREVNGVDEMNASRAADAKKTGSMVELLRLSIIEVDGEAISPPGTAPLDGWTSRTRKAVAKFFDTMNDCTPEELDPLVARANEEESAPR